MTAYGLGHVVIRASAGSGKTHRLSSRYLGLVAHGTEPGAILATTFTRKAAGEVFGRILGRLADAGLNDHAAAALGLELVGRPWSMPQAQAVLGRLTRSIHRLQVCTLDSFFTRAASGYRLELGLPASPRLIEAGGVEATQMRARAIEAMLAQGTQDDLQALVTMLRQAFGETHKRGVVASLDQLMDRLHSVYLDTRIDTNNAPDRPATAWHQIPPVDTFALPQEADAIERLRSVEPELTHQTSWRNSWKVDIERADRRDWDTLLSTGIPKKIAEGSDTFSTKRPLPDAVLAAYRPLVLHARAVQINRIIQQTTAAYDLLVRYDQAYHALQAREGVILFDELPRLLAERIMPDAVLDEVYERLDSQIDHLLLDEFQDTSPIQWKVLSPIAEEICLQERFVAPVDARLVDPLLADPEAHLPTLDPPDRSFFCVGDTKQAIYGWRGGCAPLMDVVTQSLALDASHIERLDTSYRSSPVVLDVVNRLFEDLPSAAVFQTRKPGVDRAISEWSERFAPHVAAHSDRPGWVEVFAAPLQSQDPQADAALLVEDPDDMDQADDSPAWDTGKVTARQWKAATLDAAARRTAALVADHPTATVGVLTLGNAQASELVRRLRSLGVAASGEGGGRLDDDPAVELILSALTFATHPGHTAAAWHVFHSPLREASSLDALTEPARVAAARRLRRELIDVGLTALVTRLAHAVHPVAEPRTAGRLTQLIERAEHHERDHAGQSNPGQPAKRFVQRVRQERVADPAAASVQVMTVYKAKGLQFDAVVLAQLWECLDKHPRQDLWRLRRRPTEPPIAVVRSMNAAARASLTDHANWVEDAYQQECATSTGDDLSAFYVAATRARHAMVLVVPPVPWTNKGPGKTNRNDTTPAALIRERLVPDAPHDSIGVLATWSHGSWHTPARPAPPSTPDRLGPNPFTTPQTTRQRHLEVVSPSNVKASGRIDPAVWLRPGSSPASTQADPQTTIPSSNAGRDFGIIVHAMLQTVGFIDEPQGLPTDDTLLQAARDAIHAGQAAAHVDLHAARAAVHRVCQTPETQPILQRNAAIDLWREHRFAVRRDHQLITGVIDRVVRFNAAHPNDPVARIIDFKTDPAPAADLLDRYASQLTAYRHAVAQGLGVSPHRIQAGLLATATATWATLAP